MWGAVVVRGGDDVGQHCGYHEFKAVLEKAKKEAECVGTTSAAGRKHSVNEAIRLNTLVCVVKGRVLSSTTGKLYFYQKKKVFVIILQYLLFIIC